MREYERALTTVANSYVQPQVARYIRNLSQQFRDQGVAAGLSILRSDGGLASTEIAADSPVTMLLSGPAGGVTGAVWVAGQTGHRDLLTFDMGGTSTDVALVQNLTPRTGRETKVGDLTVRASSVDVRTVGAGGGSIAHVPQLTKALRVGPQSAGAVPGPAAYGLGGTEPTVTDANVVLGYLPTSLAGGEITLDPAASRAAVQTIADAMGLESAEVAAAGIIDIVNENMLGGLRLVSVQQGFDPRQFALVAFGGAGPLHANAIGKLTGAWPVIVPPSPGVLCALGDATTSLRDESARTILRRFSDLSGGELHEILRSLSAASADRLLRQGVDADHQDIRYEVDIRYFGQGFEIPITIDPAWLDDLDKLPDRLGSAFDTEHERLFSFLLGTDHELVNARASVNGPRPEVAAIALDKGDGDPAAARTGTSKVFVDGAFAQADVYDRLALRAGDVIDGPGHRRGDGLHHLDPSRACRHHPRVRLPVDPSRRPGGLNHGACRRDEHHDAGPGGRRSGHPGPDRERSAQRPLRDGRGAVPHRTVPGIREQHDEFPLIADPSGKMVVGQFGLSIPDFLDGFDGEIGEGDVLLTSDPYACGAAISHANDWLVVTPIFVDGRLVGWASMFGHMSDVGGKTPSSCPPTPGPSTRRAWSSRRSSCTRRADQRGRAADHPEPGAGAGLEPGRPQRPGRGLPHRWAGAGDVRAVRRRHLSQRAGLAAGPELRGHEDVAAPGLRGRPHTVVHRLHL